MWFKVDDGFHKHRKRVRVGVSMEGFAAIGLWAVAGSWSSDEPSGGFVPDDVIEEYLAPGFGAQLAKRLEAAGLWTRVDGGWQFHDWRGYNPGIDEAQAAAQKMSSGGAIGNHRRWHVQAGKVDPRCRYCREVKNEPSSGTRSGGRSIGVGSGQADPDANPMPDSRKNGNGPDKNNEAFEQGGHRVPDRGPVGVPESAPNPPDPTRPDISSLSSRELLSQARGLNDRETTKILDLIHASHAVGNETAFIRKLISNGDIDRWITKMRAALDDDTPRHRRPAHDFQPDANGYLCTHAGCGMPRPHANHKTGSAEARA